MKKIIKPTSVLLAAVVLSLSFHRVAADDPEPQPAGPLAWCVAIFAGAMTVGTIVIIRNCRPKYYCMKDRDGTHFIGTATRNECQVNDWTIVSGPYDSIAAGTNNCPPVTNVVAAIPPPDMTLVLQQSTNLTDWTTVQEQVDDPSNFAFYHTNTLPSAYYRVLFLP